MADDVADLADSTNLYFRLSISILHNWGNSGLGIGSLVFRGNRSYFCLQKSEIAIHSWSLIYKRATEQFALGHKRGKAVKKL